MMKQLLNQVLADGDYFATTGAGTSAVNGSTVDMNGYEGVLFIAKFGTAAADNTIKAQQVYGGHGYIEEWSSCGPRKNS